MRRRRNPKDEKETNERSDVTRIHPSNVSLVIIDYNTNPERDVTPITNHSISAVIGGVIFLLLE